MVKHLKSEFYIPFLFFQHSVNEIPLLAGLSDRSTVTPIGVYVCVCVCVCVCERVRGNTWLKNVLALIHVVTSYY